MDVVYVLSTALGQLHAMSGFAGQTSITDVYFTDDAILRVPLPERLDVLIAAVVTALSRSITSDDFLSSLAMLKKGLRRGLTTPRRCCNECRSKMTHVLAKHDLMADLLDQNVNRWIGDGILGATIFGKSTARRGMPRTSRPSPHHPYVDQPVYKNQRQGLVQLPALATVSVGVRIFRS